MECAGWNIKGGDVRSNAPAKNTIGRRIYEDALAKIDRLARRLDALAETMDCGAAIGDAPAKNRWDGAAIGCAG